MTPRPTAASATARIAAGYAEQPAERARLTRRDTDADQLRRAAELRASDPAAFARLPATLRIALALHEQNPAHL